MSYIVLYGTYLRNHWTITRFLTCIRLRKTGEGLNFFGYFRIRIFLHNRTIIHMKLIPKVWKFSMSKIVLLNISKKLLNLFKILDVSKEAYTYKKCEMVQSFMRHVQKFRFVRRIKHFFKVKLISKLFILDISNIISLDIFIRLLEMSKEPYTHKKYERSKVSSDISKILDSPKKPNKFLNWNLPQKSKRTTCPTEFHWTYPREPLNIFKIMGFFEEQDQVQNFQNQAFPKIFLR